MSLKTYTADELAAIVAAHGKYLRGEEGGSCADLSCANLSCADLSCAYLSGANLSCADLSCANLSGADLSGAYLSRAEDGGAGAILGPSLTFKDYVEKLVPALCIAGGHTLDEVANPKVWNCHEWQNCPMATAFDVHDVGSIPILYRAEAERFIQLFDANQIPLSRVNPKFADGQTGAACAVKAKKRGKKK